MKLHENIKKYRKLNHWTQDDLAKRTGYERSMIAKIETGNVDLSQSKIKLFADTFGVLPTDLLDDMDSCDTQGRDDALLIIKYHQLTESNQQVLKATLNALLESQS